MLSRTPRARRWPNAAWWNPLVHDLVLLEAANERVGLLTTAIDLAERPPQLSASVTEGTTATVRVDPEIGGTALQQHLTRTGLTVPEPPLDSTRLWKTDPTEASPHLVHAWVLNELNNPDAFPGRSWRERTMRIDLREIRGDTTRLDVTVHLVARGYCVCLPVVLDDPNADYSGLDYALTETAARQDPEQLERMPDHHNIPTFRGPEMR